MRGRGEVHLGQYTQFSEYFQTCCLPHFLWSFQALPGLGHWPIFPPFFPHGPAKGVPRTVQNSPALQERLLGLAHRLQSRKQLVLEQLRFKLCRFNSTWFCFVLFSIVNITEAFPGGSVVKNPPAHAGDLSSIPGSGRSHGEGNGYLLQYSYLENSMDREAWWATVHWVSKESDTTE